MKPVIDGSDIVYLTETSEHQNERLKQIYLQCKPTGDAEEVERLLGGGRGVNPNAIYAEKRFLVHAVEAQNFPVMKALLADPRIDPTLDDLAALRCAGKIGFKQGVHALLGRGDVRHALQQNGKAVVKDVRAVKDRKDLAELIDNVRVDGLRALHRAEIRFSWPTRYAQAAWGGVKSVARGISHMGKALVGLTPKQRGKKLKLAIMDGNERKVRGLLLGPGVTIDEDTLKVAAAFGSEPAVSAAIAVLGDEYRQRAANIAWEHEHHDLARSIAEEGAQEAPITLEYKIEVLEAKLGMRQVTGEFDAVSSPQPPSTGEPESEEPVLLAVVPSMRRQP